jgi:hypothetical protein
VLLLLRAKPRPRLRPRRPSWLQSEPVYGAVTRIMGGTDGRGWFGNDAFGGRIVAPVTTTFATAIPAGYGLILHQTLYNYTPSDASLLSLAGSGNALALSAGAQRAHNSAGSNDGSVTFYHTVLASPCSSITYDASSLPAGDDGRYGHMVMYVVAAPDLVNGFYTATPRTNTQVSTTSVNPGTITLTTSDSLVLFGWVNRNHSEDLLPLSISPAVFPTELQHTKLHVVTNSPTDFGSVHNSITQSGSVMAYRRQAPGGTFTPVVTFTGPSPTTAAAHSVLAAYNILGGTATGGFVPFTRRTIPMRRAA